MNRENSSADPISTGNAGSFAELVDRLENNFRNIAVKRLYTMMLNSSAQKLGIRQRSVGTHADIENMVRAKIPQQGDIPVRVRRWIRCGQPIREKINESLRLRFCTCEYRTRTISVPTR